MAWRKHKGEGKARKLRNGGQHNNQHPADTDCCLSVNRNIVAEQVRPDVAYVMQMSAAIAYLYF